MTRIAPLPPAESDLLCEFCGYTLNGLNEQSNCPECGMPIRSSLGEARHLPLWEQRQEQTGETDTEIAGKEPGGGVFRKFVATTAHIIFRTTDFFKTTTARGDIRRAARFGHAHWMIASLLFGIAASLHAGLFNPQGSAPALIFTGVIGAAVFAVASYFTLWATTWIAVRLTAWEAAYRGYRLPLPVVMRVMYYHAAHYLPVGIGAAATVIGFTLLEKLGILDQGKLVQYLYVLCGEIIVAAAYLFHTYWIGMRNMMYANR